jgi:hypothetical protein
VLQDKSGATRKQAELKSDRFEQLQLQLKDDAIYCSMYARLRLKN